MTTLKSLTMWITMNCGKFFKIWEYHTTLPASREVCMQVKKQQTRTWNNGLVPNWEGVCQGCVLSPCLFNLHAECIMQNAGVDEAQAGIKTARRNINNIRYADDTILMTENEEELKYLLKKVKEESKNVGLKLNIQKTKTMASRPITSWQTDGDTMGTVTDYFLGF